MQETCTEFINKYRLHSRRGSCPSGIKIDFVFIRCRGYISARSLSAFLLVKERRQEKEGERTYLPKIAAILPRLRCAPCYADVLCDRIKMTVQAGTGLINPLFAAIFLFTRRNLEFEAYLSYTSDYDVGSENRGSK